MYSASGFIKGCRAMMAAAKANNPKSLTSKATAKAKPRSSSPSSSKPRSASSGTPKSVKPRGFQIPLPVSPALRQFLGVPETSSPDAMKKVWDYIKLHNLQNPANKKEIRCDDKLKTIFEGRDKVGILEVGKLLSTHFVRT
ncbi:hypothetical protein NMG60_11023272 [Bertholletia excelsa]